MNRHKYLKHSVTLDAPHRRLCSNKNKLSLIAIEQMIAIYTATAQAQANKLMDSLTKVSAVNLWQAFNLSSFSLNRHSLTQINVLYTHRVQHNILTKLCCIIFIRALTLGVRTWLYWSSIIGVCNKPTKKISWITGGLFICWLGKNEGETAQRQHNKHRTNCCVVNVRLLTKWWRKHLFLVSLFSSSSSSLHATCSFWYAAHLQSQEGIMCIIIKRNNPFFRSFHELNANHPLAV